MTALVKNMAGFVLNINVFAPESGTYFLALLRIRIVLFFNYGASMPLSLNMYYF